MCVYFHFPRTPGRGRLTSFLLGRCRYRLAGLPGEHQQRNITSPEISYCLVTELIIWTQYEIQVAAYNGAGLGVFSRPVTEYTLQGGKLAPRPAPAAADSLLGAGFAELDWSTLERQSGLSPLGSTWKAMNHLFNSISPSIPKREQCCGKETDILLAACSGC